MTIGDAVGAMKAGRKVTREQWSGTGKLLFLDKVTSTIVLVVDEAPSPYVVEQADVLADDWHTL